MDALDHRPSSSQVEHPASTFEPSAVPQDTSDFHVALRALQLETDDALLELGEEPLFSAQLRQQQPHPTTPPPTAHRQRHNSIGSPSSPEQHPPSYSAQYDPTWSARPPSFQSAFEDCSPAAPLAETDKPNRDSHAPHHSQHPAGEKMQHELDSVSRAVERLNSVTPQLDNQRVEPDRRQLRERQLAKLGNAIERLSQGRLNDQRAKKSLTASSSEEDPVEREIRIRKMQYHQLERLIDQIDRAASRSLADQRVDLPPHKHKEVEERDTALDEAERRKYILDNTGKGRLLGQDAEKPVVLVHSPLDYIAEESRNLGTLVVTFWPRAQASASAAGSSSAVEWSVHSVESAALLVGPSHGGPASRLALPCRVIPQQAVASFHGSFYEVKLATADASPTRARHDLEVIAPLSTAELRRAMPETYACASCDAPLVHGDRVRKYNALPSEHWAELLEAWMCHQDQTINEELVEKGKGIKPREDEGMVGSGYILFPRQLTTNWVTPEKSEIGRSPANDELHPANCAVCGALVGQHVVSLDPAAADASFVRILKYATYPVGSSTPPLGLTETFNRALTSAPAATGTGSGSSALAGQPLAPARRYSLAAHLTAEMLELGQAHACHRFAIENDEDSALRILIWLFNPAVRVSFSTSSPSNAVLAEPSSANSSPRPEQGPTPSTSADSRPRQLGRTMNAVKVFYTLVEDERDPAVQAFVENERATTESLAYPREIVDKLVELLKASSLVYPQSKRTWREMDAGFLERI